MKTILFLLSLSPFIVGQDYQKGNIDMHGGDNKYNSIDGYQNGGFRQFSKNFSPFLDQNTSKNIQKIKSEK